MEVSITNSKLPFQQTCLRVRLKKNLSERKLTRVSKISVLNRGNRASIQKKNVLNQGNRANIQRKKPC